METQKQNKRPIFDKDTYDKELEHLLKRHLLKRSIKLNDDLLFEWKKTFKLGLLINLLWFLVGFLWGLKFG